MRWLVFLLVALTVTGCFRTRRAPALTLEAIRANTIAEMRMPGTARIEVFGLPPRFCTLESRDVVRICVDNAAPVVLESLGEILSQYGMTPAAGTPTYHVAFRMLDVRATLAGDSAHLEGRWQLTMDSSDGRRLITAAETSRVFISSIELAPIFRAINDRVAALLAEAARTQPMTTPPSGPSFVDPSIGGSPPPAAPPAEPDSGSAL